MNGQMQEPLTQRAAVDVGEINNRKKNTKKRTVSESFSVSESDQTSSNNIRKQMTRVSQMLQMTHFDPVTF